MQELKNANSLRDAEKELKGRVHKLLSSNEKERKIIPLYRKLAVAASILIILSISIFLLTRTNKYSKPIAENIEHSTVEAYKTVPSAKDNITTEAIPEPKAEIKNVKGQLKKSRVAIKGDTVQLAMSVMQDDKTELQTTDNLVVKDTASEITYAQVPMQIASEKEESKELALNKQDRTSAKLDEVGLSSSEMEDNASKKSLEYHNMSSPTLSSRAGKVSKAKLSEVVTVDSSQIKVLIANIVNTIDAKEKESAIGKLEILKTKINGDSNKKEVQEIIDLVKEDKFEKALKRLKKL